MSPLKVRQRPSWFVKLHPSPKGFGQNTQVVTIAKDDALKFENDLNLDMSVYAGVVQVTNKDGKLIRNVQLNRGDRAVIQREGSNRAYIVDGVDWGRRK